MTTPIYRSAQVTVVSNQPPVVDAGPNLTATVGQNITLQGSVSDDGLPTSGQLISSWSVVSGPGAVTFGNPSSPTTTAQFAVPGTYVLQLSASDGVLIRSAQVNVSATLLNVAPVVDAGGPIRVQAGVPVILPGSVTDVTLPSGPLVVTWSLFSGPASPQFVEINDPITQMVVTQATFPINGTYILSLEASDGEFTATDFLTVLVGPVSIVQVAEGFSPGSVATATVTLPVPATAGNLLVALAGFRRGSLILPAPFVQELLHDGSDNDLVISSGIAQGGETSFTFTRTNTANQMGVMVYELTPAFVVGANSNGSNLLVATLSTGSVDIPQAGAIALAIFRGVGSLQDTTVPGYVINGAINDSATLVASKQGAGPGLEAAVGSWSVARPSVGAIVVYG